MREILFRGKAIYGDWFYGDLINLTEEIKQICNHTQLEHAHSVNPETVGQYTGLTDKNGKKIFEGDIVRTKKYGKTVGNATVNDYDTFKVIYAPALFRIENAHRGFNLVGNGADYEVIGNIHEIPNC